ncbi:MAG: hypothetical protein JW841_02980 [Deltaproteobacteria bacterium]|nr:hypothetical protein [Deltaproteobacteria bacterium]
MSSLKINHNCHICDGRENYSALSIIAENIVVIAQFVLAATLMRNFWLFNFPLLTIAFIVYCLVMLGYVLRRHLCSHCYYYDKWCHCGWGKPAALVVKKSETPMPTKSKLASFFWFSVLVLPIFTFILSLILNLTTFRTELPYLLSFTLTLVISGAMHVRDCKECKMRLVCPGSAAKKE